MPVFNPSISLYKKPQYNAFWYNANLDIVREFRLPGLVFFTLFYLATTRQPINPPDTLKKRKTCAQKPQKSNNLYRTRVQSGHAYNLMISRLYPDAIRVICWYSRGHARSTHKLGGLEIKTILNSKIECHIFFQVASFLPGDPLKNNGSYNLWLQGVSFMSVNLPSRSLTTSVNNEV